MGTKLTSAEKETMEELETGELLIMLEEHVRKRKSVMADKSAYVKACNDLKNLQEARMNFISEIIELREVEAAEASPPPPPRLAASA